jgi:hypothetical protein
MLMFSIRLAAKMKLEDDALIPYEFALTTEEFFRSPDAAKEAATKYGAVVITERGEPAYVFGTFEKYDGATGSRRHRELMESLLRED